MSTRVLSIRLFQALILIAVLCAAAVTPLKGQQSPDSARVAPASAVPTSAPQASSSNTTLGPRLSPQFQRVEPRLAPSTASEGSSLALAAGQHTIVFSTLALVLAVIIIVLLVVN